MRRAMKERLGRAAGMPHHPRGLFNRGTGRHPPADGRCASFRTRRGFLAEAQAPLFAAPRCRALRREPVARSGRKRGPWRPAVGHGPAGRPVAPGRQGRIGYRRQSRQEPTHQKSRRSAVETGTAPLHRERGGACPHRKPGGDCRGPMRPAMTGAGRGATRGGANRARSPCTRNRGGPPWKPEQHPCTVSAVARARTGNRAGDCCGPMRPAMTGAGRGATRGGANRARSPCTRNRGGPPWKPEQHPCTVSAVARASTGNRAGIAAVRCASQ
jgi:hypothetical protein